MENERLQPPHTFINTGPEKSAVLLQAYIHTHTKKKKTLLQLDCLLPVCIYVCVCTETQQNGAPSIFTFLLSRDAHVSLPPRFFFSLESHVCRAATDSAREREEKKKRGGGGPKVMCGAFVSSTPGPPGFFLVLFLFFLPSVFSVVFSVRFASGRVLCTDTHREEQVRSDQHSSQSQRSPEGETQRRKNNNNNKKEDGINDNINDKNERGKETRETREGATTTTKKACATSALLPLPHPPFFKSRLPLLWLQVETRECGLVLPVLHVLLPFNKVRLAHLHATLTQG
jgi:hypothetical protein